MFGSTFGQQARNIRRYVAGGTPGAGLQDILVSVMFWIHVPVPPQVHFHKCVTVPPIPVFRQNRGPRRCADALS